MSKATLLNTKNTKNLNISPPLFPSGNQLFGSIVEISCETDFVARTKDFKLLAHDLAMQIAAMNPKVIEISKSNENNDLDSNEDVLLKQTFIKDPEISINDLIQQSIAKLGENIKVRRFTRFSLGD